RARCCGPRLCRFCRVDRRLDSIVRAFDGDSGLVINFLATFVGKNDKSDDAQSQEKDHDQYDGDEQKRRITRSTFWWHVIRRQKIRVVIRERRLLKIAEIVQVEVVSTHSVSPSCEGRRPLCPASAWRVYRPAQ